AAAELKAGTYQLVTGMEPSQVLEALRTGPLVDVYRITIREGLRVGEMLEILSEGSGIPVEEFEAALQSGEVTTTLKDMPDSPFLQDWEGLLFPDTYEFSQRSTAVTILQRLADTMVQRVESVDWSEFEADGYSIYEGIIMASLIEAEVRVADERPLVSSVIHNRLDEGMPLQIDATVLYALGTRSPSDFDREVDSPYNTYQNTELPPTGPTPTASTSCAQPRTAATRSRRRWRSTTRPFARPERTECWRSDAPAPAGGDRRPDIPLPVPGDPHRGARRSRNRRDLHRPPRAEPRGGVGHRGPAGRPSRRRQRDHAAQGCRRGARRRDHRGGAAVGLREHDRPPPRRQAQGLQHRHHRPAAPVARRLGPRPDPGGGRGGGSGVPGGPRTHRIRVGSPGRDGGCPRRPPPVRRDRRGALGSGGGRGGGGQRHAAGDGRRTAPGPHRPAGICPHRPRLRARCHAGRVRGTGSGDPHGRRDRVPRRPGRRLLPAVDGPRAADGGDDGGSAKSLKPGR